MTEAQQMTLPGVTPRWTLGDHLRKAREIAGLSQGEMAEAIGIARNSVGRYESGSYPPSRPVLIAWAFRTGVALDWIMSGADDDGDGPVSARSTRIPAGLSGQQPNGGYETVENDITRLRKRIPLRQTSNVVTMWRVAA